MSAKYAIDGSQAVTSPTDSCLSLHAVTSGSRGFIYDLILGSAATPADNALQWIIQRFSDFGTGTTVVGVPLDEADAVARCIGKEDHTVEPTYTSAKVLAVIDMNQRSTQRWVASPGGELVVPLTNINGIGLQPVHASFTGVVDATMHWRE